MLVWTLTYHLNNPEIRTIQNLRFEALSDKQGATVYHVLEWLLTEQDGDFIKPSDDSSDLWQAKDNW